MLALLIAAALFPHRVSPGLMKRPNLVDRWGWTFLLTLCLLLAYGTVRKTASDLGEEPVHILEMAEVLRARADPGDTIIIRKPHLAFHAGLVSAFPLAESAGEFRLAAERVGARFLEYSRDEARRWPGLDAVADPASVAHLGFRVVYESADANAILYELEPLPR